MSASLTWSAGAGEPIFKARGGDATHGPASNRHTSYFRASPHPCPNERGARCRGEELTLYQSVEHRKRRSCSTHTICDAFGWGTVQGVVLLLDDKQGQWQCGWFGQRWHRFLGASSYREPLNRARDIVNHHEATAAADAAVNVRLSPLVVAVNVPRFVWLCTAMPHCNRDTCTEKVFVLRTTKVRVHLDVWWLAPMVPLVHDGVGAICVGDRQISLPSSRGHRKMERLLV